jgi:hypothetical protein
MQTAPTPTATSRCRAYNSQPPTEQSVGGFFLSIAFPKPTPGGKPPVPAPRYGGSATRGSLLGKGQEGKDPDGGLS